MPAFRVPAHPGSTSSAMSHRLSHQPRRDTKPELRVRRRLHALGYRFRVAYPVPGLTRRTIDIAFPRQRVALFIDGCFWHGCPDHGTSPVGNANWWVTKITTNQRRDRDTGEHLVRAGWTVLRFWEHEHVDSVLQRTTGLLRGTSVRGQGDAPLAD